LLNERAREIINKADAPNKAKAERELHDINEEWNRHIIAELENRKETLTRLAEHWEVKYIEKLLSKNKY
jgi:phage gp29-like protein